mmetsp:Transcript_16952/g.25652  ORF Transcript_16952/g.25652 Transcript_16952/m.25652 type:complete len:251 (-) Transcript_16952:87-839(-)
MKYLLTLLSCAAIIPVALSLRGSDNGRNTLECTEITTLHSKIFENPFTQCCSHSDCEDGMRCKNMRFYLRCVPADQYTRYYEEICNEDPDEASICGKPVETRKPDCVSYLDIKEEVFEHKNTNCHTNEDCDDGVDCLVFGDTFTMCDREKHFTTTYPSICIEVDTVRDGDDETTVDTDEIVTSDCVDPLTLMDEDEEGRNAFNHVSSNCRSSQNCGDGVECRVFGNNVFTACDPGNDFEDFPAICHHEDP